jgi:hypothetical protein
MMRKDSDLRPSDSGVGGIALQERCPIWIHCPVSSDECTSPFLRLCEIVTSLRTDS